MTGSSWRLGILAVLVALAGIAGYALLLRVPAIRNHPELYVAASALGVALALLALRRGRTWPAWAALTLTVLLLAGTSVFNFVIARVPSGPTAVRVGERAPDFTLPDATGRPVRLADFRGKSPVVVVFYRGHW